MQTAIADPIPRLPWESLQEWEETAFIGNGVESDEKFTAQIDLVEKLFSATHCLI